MDIDAWKELKDPVTICDENGIIIYMNEASIQQFIKYGGDKLLGSNLLDCHPEPSKSKLKAMLDNPESNTYITVKNGVKKFIHQTPFFENGIFKGLIEISVNCGTSIPEYNRD